MISPVITTAVSVVIITAEELLVALRSKGIIQLATTSPSTARPGKRCRIIVDIVDNVEFVVITGVIAETPASLNVEIHA